jgi:hypothetical protein
MADEPQKQAAPKEQVFVAAPMGDIVKQTLYRKYQLAMDLQRELYYQRLRKPGKMNSNTQARFKALVTDLVLELTPKFRGHDDFKDYVKIPAELMLREEPVETYFMILAKCAEFLDKIKVTEIFTQRQTGAAGMNRG